MPPAIKLRSNTPLAPLTTLKVGGAARYFVEVSSEDELIKALGFAKENDLNLFILGGGSNVVISDSGFDGLVVKIARPHEKGSGSNSRSVRARTGIVSSLLQLTED